MFNEIEKEPHFGGTVVVLEKDCFVFKKTSPSGSLLYKLHDVCLCEGLSLEVGNIDQTEMLGFDHWYQEFVPILEELSDGNTSFDGLWMKVEDLPSVWYGTSPYPKED